MRRAARRPMPLPCGSSGEPCGTSVPVAIVEPAGSRWPNHAVHAPRVGDALQRRQQRDGGVAVAGREQRFGLVQHRLIEPRAAAARLIDDVGRDAFAHEVRIPTFALVGRRLERGARVRRAVHHDHGPAGRRAARRDLELHVHLADRDLLRRARRRRLARRRERHRRVLADLGHAADEEAALVLERDGTAREALRAPGRKQASAATASRAAVANRMRGMRRTSSLRGLASGAA